MQQCRHLIIFCHTVIVKAFVRYGDRHKYSFLLSFSIQNIAQLKQLHICHNRLLSFKNSIKSYLIFKVYMHPWQTHCLRITFVESTRFTISIICLLLDVIPSIIVFIMYIIIVGSGVCCGNDYISEIYFFTLLNRK